MMEPPSKKTKYDQIWRDEYSSSFKGVVKSEKGPTMAFCEHTGERNYHCTWPGCRKSFRHADNLKVHFRSHTNEKPVQCHLCDFKCKQKNSLFWHKKKVHQIVDASTVISKRNESTEVKPGETSPKDDIVDQATSQPTFGDKKSGPSSLDSGVTDDSKPHKKDGNESDKNLFLEGERHTRLDNVRDIAVGTSSDLRMERTSVTGLEGESGDLYEFRSDEESDDEKLSPLRREKVKTAALTPLPPPPKELLLKNEMQEQKEREKQEKAERKEQEKKEKAERKEQEKKARAEKKEREKKEKLEKKEIERKEKEEKKELEKKEKEEKKELEKKEKEEKKELERKQKEEKREQEKKEKEERKEQEKKERAEKKEKEKKERERRMLEVKRLKMEARRILHRGSTLKRKRTTSLKLNKDSSQANAKAGSSSKEKKSRMSNLRRKSPGRRESEAKPEKIAKKVGRGRKKKVVSEDTEEADLAEDVEGTKKVGTRRTRTSSGRGTPKEEKLTPSSSRSSSPRAASRKSPALQKMTAVTRGAGSKATSPPKRKPSARIKANNKAKTKKAKFTSKKTSTKTVPAKKKPGRKKSPVKAKEEATEDGGIEDESEEKDNKRSEDNLIVADDTTVKAEAIKDDTQIAKDQVPRPVSPAYSEENMLQGKASPYRDFSDAENLEEKDAEESQTSSTPMQSPKEVESVSKSHTKLPEDLAAGEEHEEDDSKTINDEGERPISCPLEESSDDEVSNDIPLTPPRAPAPPPRMESSEDEMEPEPDQMEPEPDQMEPEPDHTQPFSVPAPSTPFSNPGPNTPFSVPPPTNLMQQHSVHSTEEMPMSAAVPSVASMEIPSVEMQQAQGSVELNPHGSVEMHHNSSVEMNQSHGSVEMQASHSSISEPLSQSESQIPHSNMSGELPSTPREGGSSALSSHDKYGLPPVLEDDGQTSEADRKCFDQYLKNLNAAHSGMECSSPSGLQQLEAMVDKSHMESRDLISKSPQINQHHPAMPTSVITSLEGTLPHMPPTELRARIDPLAERHHESLYTRDSMSALPRLPDRQSATPLLSNHATPAPAFDAFSTLNPLHSSSVNSRENSYLRQQESIFATPPVTSSFMAEAMFQRQAMTTPFLPPTPQASDRSSLSRISDPTSTLRTNNTPTLLRRPTTMPGTDMFTTPTVPQTMPRHPFTNVWPGQDVRPTHWQSPYLPRQPNMGHANSPFFPPKENYLTGREFMFDPSSVRSSTERGMFSSLSSAQTQDSFQMDRFDISNYFPNPMTPYGSSTGTLDYTRSTHSVAPKPFDSRYRQTAGVATSAAIPEFRGLPPTTAAPEMFPSIGVNSGFNLYAGNPMSYHTQHMTDNMNSAFLTHSSSAQHAMLERDYAAAAAHRGLYPHHQNTTYPFIDERQYSGTSKLAPTHPAPTSVTQERDLMSRTAAPETQMQDPYRSMLYRY